MGRLRLLPETAPQSGVLLIWPHPRSDWQETLESVESVYLEMAREITGREVLIVVCYDRSHRQQVEARLSRNGVPAGTVRFFIAPSDDTWCRDYAPLALAGTAGIRLTDFTFDGWGGKYPAGQDNELTRRLQQAGAFGGAEYLRHPLVLEAGSVDTDGEGTLLTTTRCLLAHSRNPGYDKHSLQVLFAELLGIDRVLWLEHGMLEGDDTDGHIDMLARFCAPDTIAYVQCSDPDDSHNDELAAMEQQLREFRDHRGQPYRLVPLPLPRAIYNESGQRLPASYANFLIINGAVLVPVYADPVDAVAVKRIAGCFPDREVCPVNCLALIQQFGSLHCATMQLPEGVIP